ncbi:hypothetical protein M9458_040976, partial [Cirrhinus mrigala]
PAKLISQCCGEQTKKIQDDPEEVMMMMKEEEEACEHTQETDLNSSSCLTSAQSSNEEIIRPFDDGMNVAEEA